jgi:hypothetical protein
MIIPALIEQIERCGQHPNGRRGTANVLDALEVQV